MKNVWFIADTHFGHKGATIFSAHDDPSKKMRPWNTVEEMDEALIQNWNSVVNDQDRVYVVGDFCINKKSIQVAGLLKGRLVLIKGNHDIFKLNLYTPFFEDIRAYHVFDKILISHIPVHESQKDRYVNNVHGHLHDRKLDDPWYHCVSVEQIGFTPIHYEDLKLRLTPPE